MKKVLFALLPVLMMSACAVPYHTPTVSSTVIEANPNGSLINISTLHCGGDCVNLAMLKAQEACPRGYVIKNTENARGYVMHGVLIRDVRLTVRCSNQ